MKRDLKSYPAVELHSENLQKNLNFFDIFGRSGPVHIEIGTGKGSFLLNQAKAQPDTDFLGVEWARKYYRYTVDRIGRWDLTNVRMIRTDAGEFVRECIPSDSVDCFHIYFPDPWPKKRHHKRRFINKGNLEHILRCMKKAGVVRIATDHAEYFEWIGEAVALYDPRFEKIEFTAVAGAEAGEVTGTNYERKYIKDKRQIYTMALMKIR